MRTPQTHLYPYWLFSSFSSLFHSARITRLFIKHTKAANLSRCLAQPTRKRSNPSNSDSWASTLPIPNKSTRIKTFPLPDESMHIQHRVDWRPVETLFGVRHPISSCVVHIKAEMNLFLFSEPTLENNRGAKKRKIEWLINIWSSHTHTHTQVLLRFMAAIFFHLITLDGRRLFTGSSTLVRWGQPERQPAREGEKRKREIRVLNSISVAIIIHLLYSTSFGVYKVFGLNLTNRCCWLLLLLLLPSLTHTRYTQ